MSKVTYSLEVIMQKVGIEKQDVLNLIECNIISPYKYDDFLFDDEDLARLGLICELRECCDPNEESLQVILHLIDQIHYLKNK